MKKSQATRNAILENSVRTISGAGLNALTIGQLANTCGLSKSGLMAHFGSKENLQLEALKHLVGRFEQQVIIPTGKSSGLEKLRQLFINWLEWAEDPKQPQGCALVAASMVAEERSGPVQEYLKKMQILWVALLAKSAADEIGKSLNSQSDPEQFAYEIYSLYLGFHYFKQVLGDRQAKTRAMDGFERLVKANANL